MIADEWNDRGDGSEARTAAGDLVEVGVDEVEQRQPVTRRLVTHVVDEAGQHVDVEQLAAPLRPQQAARDGKVLPLCPGRIERRNPGIQPFLLRRTDPHRRRNVSFRHFLASGVRQIHAPERKSTRMGTATEPPWSDRPFAAWSWARPQGVSQYYTSDRAE